MLPTGNAKAGCPYSRELHHYLRINKTHSGDCEVFYSTYSGFAGASEIILPSVSPDSFAAKTPCAVDARRQITKITDHSFTRVSSFVFHRYILPR
jgi:hypothetical protein